MKYTIVYIDFAHIERTAQVRVEEPAPGEFYATDLGEGLTQPDEHKVLGCSKTCSAVVHWKPVKAAITELLGGRELMSYKELV